MGLKLTVGVGAILELLRYLIVGKGFSSCRGRNKKAYPRAIRSIREQAMWPMVMWDS
jgi:hypothetical protein